MKKQDPKSQRVACDLDLSERSQKEPNAVSLKAKIFLSRPRSPLRPDQVLTTSTFGLQKRDNSLTRRAMGKAMLGTVLKAPALKAKPPSK